MTKYCKCAEMACREAFNSGIPPLLPDVFLKVCTLCALLLLWQSVLAQGADAGMSAEQMLRYTYMSALLADQLVVVTSASGWLSEGVLLRLYGRPLSVLGQLAAHTAGGWAPTLLLFSLPMLLLSPVLGISLQPASKWFFPSLALCMALGFAIDILFACLAMRLRNMTWLISRIRTAVVALFSGTVIPIRLLPLGLDQVLPYQPFACLGGSPLSLFVGTALPKDTLLLQVLWNLALWPCALAVYRKSQERMVSYGG